MFEVLSLILNEGKVKRLKHNVPESVTVNVNIDSIRKKETNVAILEFSYEVDYEPKIAKVRVAGEAYCRDTPDNIKKAMAEFKKKKILPMEYGARAINMINATAGVNSIFMIRPFNLMPPFMPPLVTTEDLSKRKKKKK